MQADGETTGVTGVILGAWHLAGFRCLDSGCSALLTLRLAGLRFMLKEEVSNPNLPKLFNLIIDFPL